MVSRLPIAGRSRRSNSGPERPLLALGPILGLTLALVTLVVALGRLAIVEYVAANGAEANLVQRLDRGLATTTAFLNEERTRTLLSAEAATDTAGLPEAIATGDQAVALPLLEAARRTANVSQLAAVDASGKLLASSPATNFPFAQTNPVRQALNGRSAVGPIEDGGAVALLAAAPFRQDDRVVGAILALQRLNDDLLTSAVRDTGLSAALVTQGRIVAATSALRTRITAERNPTIGLIPASSGQPGRLTIGSSVFD